MNQRFFYMFLGIAVSLVQDWIPRDLHCIAMYPFKASTQQLFLSMNTSVCIA